MNDFTRKLITEWRRLGLPFEGENILIAVSGGADSCALALGISHLVNRRKFKHQFVVAHFNHRLRGLDSDQDADFVKKLAGDLGFDFVGGNAKSGALDGIGNIEQAARKARYAFLEAAAGDIGSHAVLAAHTQNDQAETLLLNLIRGSGLDGLSGMEAVRHFSKPENHKGVTPDDPSPLLVRPLLNWALREDCENYLEENKLVFREDSMNDDLRFARVRIRKDLLPLLSEFNPKVVETLARTSGVIRSELNSLAEFEEADFASLTGGSEGLRLADLQPLSTARTKGLIRYWLKSNRGGLLGISHKHIESVLSLSKSRKSGRTVEIPGHGMVCKRGGMLIFEQVKVEK